MPFDIDRETIFRTDTGEIVVDGLQISKREVVEIVKETPGDFVIRVKKDECDLHMAEDNSVRVTKEMLAAMNAAAQ